MYTHREREREIERERVCDAYFATKPVANTKPNDSESSVPTT
jgi:hypothetical protein